MVRNIMAIIIIKWKWTWTWTEYQIKYGVQTFCSELADYIQKHYYKYLILRTGNVMWNWLWINNWIEWNEWVNMYNLDHFFSCRRLTLFKLTPLHPFIRLLVYESQQPTVNGNCNIRHEHFDIYNIIIFRCSSFRKKLFFFILFSMSVLYAGLTKYNPFTAQGVLFCCRP